MRLTSAALENQLEKVKELEGRLTFRLSVLSKILDQQSSELLKDSPLSLTAYRILNVVKTFETISISDLSRFTALDRAQISRSAEALAQKGFVVFEADPDSKRKKLVRLSEQGHDVLAEVRPRFEKRQEVLRDSLGPEAEDALWNGISKLGEVLSS